MRVFFLLLLGLVIDTTLGYGCVNENGQPLDWFVSLRIPNSRTYLIYEPHTKSFRPTDELLLKSTVDQLSFAQNKFTMWNDQTIFGDASSSKAHAKGFVHYQEGGKGFVFVHSIPQFVNTTLTNDTFNYITRETSSYGQSIVCITLNSKAEVDTVIAHLNAERANIFATTFDIPTRVLPTIPTLVDDLPSGFKMVTKTTYVAQKPFEEMLVNYYRTSWLSNTWGRPWTNSTCDTEFKISNVKVKNLGGVVMKTTQDHSKWALSFGDQRRIVCIGDLNHMDSQATRGGSFMCKDDPDLYKAFYSTLLEDDCLVTKNFQP
jgi:hypothetical protein